MADFSSLKQTIQSYIKQNGNEEITGNILQDVLLAMVSTMGDSAINSLASALQDEITARQNQDATLQGIITAETTARQQADTALGGRIDGLQTAINGINTKLAEGYIYAGIATPSTNPSTPTGKVFYIATAAGTYTNFLDSGSTALVVTQGINILKFNGTAWSAEQVAGIDTTPIPVSTNLVESSGVYGAIQENQLIKSFNLFDKNITEDGYLNPDGIVVGGSSSGFQTSEFIYVKGLSSVNILNVWAICGYNENFAFISGTRENFNHQPQYNHPIPSEVVWLRLSAQDSSIPTVQLGVGVLEPWYQEYTEKYIENLNVIDASRVLTKHFSNLGNIDSQFYLINLFNKEVISSGYYVTPSGGFAIADGYFISDFIFVGHLQGKEIRYINTFRISAYNANKAWVEDPTTQNTESEDGLYTVPSTVCYIVLSGRLANLDVVQIGEKVSRANYTGYGKYDLPNYAGAKIVAFNKFNKNSGVTNGVYVVGDGREIPNAEYSASDFIDISDIVKLRTAYCHFVAFFDGNKNAIGQYICTDFLVYVNEVPIQQGAKYIRVSFRTATIDSVQAGEYINIFQFVNNSRRTIDQSVFDESQIYENITEYLDLDIPSVVYLRKNEEFSIWYRNIIFNSLRFYKGRYTIRVQKIVGNTIQEIGINCTHDKWNYIPTTTDSFQVKIRIMRPYTLDVVAEKDVTFYIVDPASLVNKTKSLVILGDSFTDQYGVSKYVYQFLQNDGFSVTAFGVNDADYNGMKDDAWSGWSIEAFFGKEGYLRADRPLSDAYWDTGWGEGEEHGWTEGQTYADLTDEQRSHGHTKNEFYNPTTQTFDFSYYMQTYHPSSFTHMVNLYDYSLVESGYIKIEDGTIVPSNDISHTPYIDVHEEQSLKFFGTLQCAWYDQNQQYISGSIINTVSAEQTINVPSGAYYLRFSNYNVYLPTAYINAERQGTPVDIVVLNIGLNSAFWSALMPAHINDIFVKLQNIIQSIKSYNQTTKIILCPIVPTPKCDALYSNQGNSWNSSEVVKTRQERYNHSLINIYDNAEARANGVYIATTNAHYDVEAARITSEIQTNKFDASIKEVVTSNIHPNANGAKYLADSIVNVIENV